MEQRADSFLRLVRRSQRGRLKIYLGYCAGVGKTYQMLLEAQRFKEDNIDVVAGLVETHGRQETECLITGLEVIPRRRIVIPADPVLLEIVAGLRGWALLI